MMIFSYNRKDLYETFERDIENTNLKHYEFFRLSPFLPSRRPV